MRNKRFTFLCNKEERWLIARIAKRLNRSQGDAVRFLINAAAQELGIGKEEETIKVDTGRDVTNGK